MLFLKLKKMNAREIFATRMKQLRAERGWSQDELAAYAGLHRAYVGTIERCEKSVTLDTVEKVANAFALPISDMFHMD